jgi:hypothetical protein
MNSPLSSFQRPAGGCKRDSSPEETNEITVVPLFMPHLLAFSHGSHLFSVYKYQATEVEGWLTVCATPTCCAH